MKEQEKDMCNCDSACKKECVADKESDYSYYSRILNRPFDTLEDLKLAEKAFEEKNRIEFEKKQERKDAAAKVEAAYNDYLHLIATSEKAIQEARDYYYSLRADFIKKYGSYHQSYSDKDATECKKYDSLFDAMLDLFNINVL